MKEIMLKTLNQYFGYESFRKGQEDVICNILSGRDVMAIMPTGGGKSICYQIPAIIMGGMTIVISPLISLMKDQVDNLVQSGVACAYINSSLSMYEFNSTIQAVRNGACKLLYVAPERLENQAFLEMLKDLEINMVAVDEAHCVSQWGHDFRPSYTQISSLIDYLPKRPVVAAFTATATDIVRKDIKRLLELDDAYTLTTGFDRPNLHFSVYQDMDKLNFVKNYIYKHKEQSGIIYCSTRKEVDSLSASLCDEGIKALPYHAGLNEDTRKVNQEEFIYDRVQIIVATNAFGMGIDKANIRYVIHYNMPSNMEGYYQEAGRAGRDGGDAECILLYAPKDIMVQKYIIKKGENEKKVQEDLERLQYIINYCTTTKCLRAYILEYFGEKADEKCDNCSNCSSHVESVDITIESQKIMSCIKRMNERYGSGLVADVLHGSKNKKVKELGFDGLSTYGIMSDYSTKEITNIINYLVSIKLIDQDLLYSTLSLNRSCAPVLMSNKKVYMHKRILIKNDKQDFSNKKCDSKLFNMLVEKRKEISSKQNIPPYIIFSDITLREMAIKQPLTSSDFLNIHGVGKMKYERYGNDFMYVIAEYVGTQLINENKKIKNSKKSNVKTDKVHTRMISYDLYKQGKSVQDIAKERNLNIGTIENHLIECKLNGLKVEGIVQEEFKDMIYSACEEVGTSKLKDIKDELPKEVTYNSIKYFLKLYIDKK